MCDGGVGLGFTGPLVLSGSLLLSWPTEANVCSPKTSQLDLSSQHCVLPTLLKTEPSRHLQRHIVKQNTLSHINRNILIIASPLQ